MADEEKVVDQWLKLENLYMMKSLTNKLCLNCMFSLCMMEGTPLKEHLDELNTILMDLKMLMLMLKETMKILPKFFYALFRHPMRSL